jgi:alanine dehydrogenase
MNTGIPSVRRTFEYRVGLIHAGKGPLNSSGCSIFIVHNAGTEAGFPDIVYKNADKRIVVVKLRTVEAIQKRPTVKLGVTPYKEELRHLSRFARQGG